MKKITTKSLSASIMRMAAVCLFLLTGSLSASAANGDRFNCKDLIVTPTDLYWARLEVVSEADATVKIISREDEGEGYVNTLAVVADEVQSFWIKNEATNPASGKTYKIIGIGAKAFIGMEQLAEVVALGDYIEFVEDQAFKDCPKLEAVNLPEGLKTIGNEAFRNCQSLYCTYNGNTYDDKLYLPSTLQRIGRQAFQNCPALKAVAFNDGLEYIDRWGFAYCRQLTDVELPNTVDVNGGVFAHCDNVKSITTLYVSDEGKTFSFDDVLFRDLENGNAELAAFPGGRDGEYVIPDFCISLGNFCFDCSKLSSVTIPSTVKNIGKNAFVDNTQLTSVYTEWLTPEDLPTTVADGYPFYSTSAAPSRTLYIPNEGTNETSATIAQTYQGSEWNSWFDDMKSYTPGNVAGLIVGGYSVKRTHVKDITNSGIEAGRASYDLATTTLTLDNVVITTQLNDDWGVGNSGISGLTIKLIGNNVFNTNCAGIFANQNTYIEGPGKLTIDSYYEEAIRLEYWDLFINNATLDLSGRGGAISGDDYPYVYVTNSNLLLRPTGASGVATVNGISRFITNDCHIAQPMFGALNEHEICDYQGNPSYGYVTVKPGNSFGFYIESDVVTDLNYTNIVPEGLQEGKISYDPESNVLTLDNVRHFSNNGFLTNNNLGLEVKLVGNNYINTTSDCITLYDNLTIYGSGKLTTAVDMGVAVYLMKDYSELYCVNTDVTLNGVGGAIHGDPTVDGAAVEFRNTNAKLSSNGMYPVTKDLDYFQLYDCEFASDDFYYDSDKGCICDYRFYGDPVYQDVVEIVRTGTATSIEESVSSTPSTQQPSPLYDLQGRRINGKPQPGVFIQSGKKIIIK